MSQYTMRILAAHRDTNLIPSRLRSLKERWYSYQEYNVCSEIMYHQSSLCHWVHCSVGHQYIKSTKLGHSLNRRWK